MRRLVLLAMTLREFPSREVQAMRLLVMLITTGLAMATGCGGSHQDVRVYPSVPVEPPQRALDQVAANMLNGLFR